jgi:hypothetical protein
MKLRGNISHDPMLTNRAQPAHLHPALPEARSVLPALPSHGLPEADTEQEGREDDGALRRPKGIGVEVLADEAEVVQIEEQVVHAHPEHRRAAQGVQPIEALRQWGHGDLAAACRARTACRRRSPGASSVRRQRSASVVGMGFQRRANRVLGSWWRTQTEGSR